MKKLLILAGLSLGTVLWANPIYHDKSIKEHHKTHIKNKAFFAHNHKEDRLRKRTFRTAEEYQKHRKVSRHHDKHLVSHLRGRSYDREERYRGVESYFNQKHRHKVAHGHRDYRQSWYVSYCYEQASFYDRHGYYYGYFNHRGYMFEGEFYRYDRLYTYRDRVRGRGLFEHRYYEPIVEYIGYNERCYR